MHKDIHPLQNRIVILKSDTPELDGQEFRIEDWWDHNMGRSWMTSVGNPQANHYATRSGYKIPIDDEVIYGFVNGNAMLIHDSELVKASMKVG